MNEEELALHFLQEYYNIPTNWEDYKIIQNAIRKNQQLKEQLKQKEDIINKANKKIDNMFDMGDGDKVIDDLLELQKILDNKGE